MSDQLSPNTGQAADQPKSWDKRAWLIGGVGGGVVAIVVAIGSSNTLERVYPSQMNVLQSGGSIVTCLVMPPILAGIARRKWLLWPFLPFLLTTIVGLLTVSADPKEFLYPTTWSEVMVGIYVTFGCTIVTMLPVVIFRWNKAKRSQRELLLQMAQDTVPPEPGAWPPRPTDPGE